MKRQSRSRAEVVRPTAWSASRLDTFEVCPQKLAFDLDPRFPRREPEPGTPLAEGKRIHKEAEDYLNGTTRQVPAAFRYFDPDLRELRRVGAIAEQQWAFAEDWTSCDWYAPRAWCRAVLDAHVVKRRGTEILVVDFKTGQPRPKDEAQLGLYALCAFMRFPKIREALAYLWYTKTGDEVKITYTRDEDLAPLRHFWEQRAQRMLTATEFPATPGPPGRWPCGFCDYSKVKGGPCRAG